MYHLPQIHQCHKKTGGALRNEQTTLYCNEKEGFKQNGEQLVPEADAKRVT